MQKLIKVQFVTWISSSENSWNTFWNIIQKAFVHFMNRGTCHYWLRMFNIHRSCLSLTKHCKHPHILMVGHLQVFFLRFTVRHSLKAIKTQLDGPAWFSTKAGDSFQIKYTCPWEMYGGCPSKNVGWLCLASMARKLSNSPQAPCTTDSDL